MFILKTCKNDNKIKFDTHENCPITIHVYSSSGQKRMTRGQLSTPPARTAPFPRFFLQIQLIISRPNQWVTQVQFMLPSNPFIPEKSSTKGPTILPRPPPPRILNCRSPPPTSRAGVIDSGAVAGLPPPFSSAPRGGNRCWSHPPAKIDHRPSTLATARG